MTSTPSFLHHYVAAIQERLHANHGDNKEELSKITMIYGLILTGACFLIVFGINACIQGAFIYAEVNFLVFLLLAVLFILLWVKKCLTFCVHTGIGIMFILYIYLFITGGVAGNAYLWNYTFPLLAFYLLGVRKGFMVTFVFVLSCTVIMLIDINTSMINLYDGSLAFRFLPSLATVSIFSLIYERYRENSLKEIADKSLYLDSILRFSTTVAIAATDRKLRIKYFNPEAERIFNCKAVEILGKKLPEIHTKEGIGLNRLSQAIKQVEEKGFYRFSSEQQTSTGVLHIYSQITGIWDHNDNLGGFLLMSRDVTEKRNQAHEKAQMEEKLHRAQKMEAIGLMAGGVAHDLNNILCGIVGYPQLILQKLPEDSELRKPITSIRESGMRAATVVNDLLTVARGVSAPREAHNINSLTQQYLNSPEYIKLHSLYPEITCSHKLEAMHGNILCSPVHVKKCLMNLVNNAVEAVIDDGSVFISSKNESIDDAWAEKQAMTAGDYVVLSVRDTGPGIEKTDLEHIFEPFYTKKIMGRSGTGLGLAVVWNTMQDHRGKVFVDSDDRGTCFQLYFPLSTEVETANPDGDEQLALNGKGESILVVDDEAQPRELAEDMLTTLGYSVQSVSSGELAVIFLKENLVDLIIIDMLMDPGMNGLHTYKKIIEMHPEQKAVIASGFSRSVDVRETIKLGAGGFIKKPYSMDQLGRLVHEVLNGVLNEQDKQG